MPRPADAPPQALLIAAFDSQLKWVAGIRDELVARGFDCTVVVPQVRSALSAGQIAAAGFARSGAGRLGGAARPVGGQRRRDLWSVGTVHVALHVDLAAVDLAVRVAEEAGPVVVTGWVGVIIEKITAGYLDRVGSDIVAVNCVDDLEHFVTVAQQLELATGQPAAVGAADPRLHGRSTGSGPVRRVLFADQPTVPGPASERLHLYRRLIDYAYAHPEREVLLKPRHRPGEDTFHTMKHHPEDLLAGVDRPPNFRIDYTAIGEILPDVDLLLTMSSTACLEAIGRGCRVGLVLDLGVHERYGNHVFLASGLLRTFDQLIADDIGIPDRSWLGSYFFDRPGTATEQIADRVEKLLATGERPSHRIWESAYFTSTAAYLRTTPVPGDAGRRGRSTLVRDLVPPMLMRRARRLRRRIGSH